MDLNYSKIIIFFIILIGTIFGYYKFILDSEEGENKPLKLAKRVLILIIIFGVIHMYSVTENQNIKYIFVLVLAVLINIYSVFHSTKQCNFPTMYIINLVLYSAFITIVMGGLLWYTTTNTLFGFMLNEETKEIADTISSTTSQVFNSNIITSNLNLENKFNCPDPNDTDNYTLEMNRLHTSESEEDRKHYNDCLEQEVRNDLKAGI